MVFCVLLILLLLRTFCSFAFEYWTRRDDEPKLNYSPWMRGAPQPSCAIVRMRRRISASIRGRPGRCFCRAILAQWCRNRSRIHFATVSGFTMTNRVAQPCGAQGDLECAVEIIEHRPCSLLFQCSDLLPQRQILAQELLVRTQDGAQGMYAEGDEEGQQTEHGGRVCLSYPAITSPPPSTLSGGSAQV